MPPPPYGEIQPMLEEGDQGASTLDDFLATAMVVYTPLYLRSGNVTPRPRGAISRLSRTYGRRQPKLPRTHPTTPDSVCFEKKKVLEALAGECDRTHYYLLAD